MKLYIKTGFLLFALSMFSLTSCEIEEIPNPNSATVDDLADATEGQLQNLVSGMESLARKEIGFYFDVTSIIGRDYWFFTGSDPRYTGELLGKGESTLDNAGFYGTRPYAGRYANVKNGNLLIEAVENTSAPLSDAQKNGYTGFAKTMMAYELHLALNLQFGNGIRVDVSDPDNLGPFLSYTESLQAIADLLDEAADDLGTAGDDFNFTLSEGFAGFDTPPSFLSFNRGLAARIALYQGNMPNALKFLDDSFLDMDASFDVGPFRPYSTAGGEQTNPVFRSPNQSEAIVAHPEFVAALDPNDDRNSKVAMRDEQISLDDLTGDHDVVLFNSLTSPISYLRNEELILIEAEANIGTDATAAIAAIDVIRTRHGLAPYAGGNSETELLDEVLNQRRFSLFAEGHRWVDMRRNDRLDEIPIDRPDDDVWVELPRPVSEQ